jgi:hypothetical protein
MLDTHSVATKPAPAPVLAAASVVFVEERVKKFDWEGESRREALAERSGEEMDEMPRRSEREVRIESAWRSS